MKRMDRENVIKEFEHLLNAANGNYQDFVDLTVDVGEEILALLKEQEPKQIKTDMYGDFYCPWCSTDRSIEMGVMKLHLGTSYCPYCGKAVKWDD